LIHHPKIVLSTPACAVVPSVKHCQHICPPLLNLHWLPVNQHITYKITALTFETLHYEERSYQADLHTHSHSPNLKCSNKHPLRIPYIKSSIESCSFAFYSPTIWNALPLCLRMSNFPASFVDHVKTNLFPQ